MSDAAFMLKELSQPWRPGEFVKDVIARIAPLAGLSQTRASDIWYGKARRVEEGELARIVVALDKKKQRSIWNAITKMEAELAQLKSIVAQSDADFGQPASAVGGRRLHLAGEARRSASGGR